MSGGDAAGVGQPELVPGSAQAWPIREGTDTQQPSRFVLCPCHARHARVNPVLFPCLCAARSLLGSACMREAALGSRVLPAASSCVTSAANDRAADVLPVCRVSAPGSSPEADLGQVSEPQASPEGAATIDLEEAAADPEPAAPGAGPPALEGRGAAVRAAKLQGAGGASAGPGSRAQGRMQRAAEQLISRCVPVLRPAPCTTLQGGAAGYCRADVSSCSLRSSRIQQLPALDAHAQPAAGRSLGRACPVP